MEVATVLVDLGAGPVGHAVPLVVAQDQTPPPDKGAEFGKASPVGLVVILLLLIATVFLIRSMTKHLRRVPSSFGPPEERAAGEHPAGGDRGAAAPGAAGEAPPHTPGAGATER
ncbi:MAG TPA: hypothetical protein VF667_11480 [Pseudonocardia sp.]